MITYSPSLMRGLTLLFVLASIMGCEDEEPSTAATMECTMGLSSNAALQGKLTIEDAYLHILKIDLQANSTTGGQSILSSENSDAESPIFLTGGDNMTPFHFDAQQGNYDPLILTLILRPDTYQLKITEEEGVPPTVDFADFLQNGKPSLAFAGKFTNRGQAVKVYIALNIPDKLIFPAAQKSQSLISLGKENRAKITLDPAVILQDITVQSLEAATMIEYLGQPLILIHPQFNSSLYNDIEARMLTPEKVFKSEIIIKSNG
jgi:hypothetical protein